MAQVTRRRSWSDDRGAELIELAIVLPMLLLVFAAIIDFGMLFQRYEVLTNAAREGARVGVLDGYTQADIEARVNTYLTASGLTVTGNPTTVAYSNTTLPSGKTISLVTVTVQYPANFYNLGPMAALVTGNNSWTSMNLKATSIMRRELFTPAGS